MATCAHTTPLRAPPEAPAQSPHDLKAPLPVIMGPPPSEPDDVRTLVEIDHRRGSIGVHIASDITRAAQTTSSLWLAPDRAEALALAILAAVEAWREQQQVAAWTTPARRAACAGGAA
ncbi:hypothetical protein [Reyranella sp.]|uniref:hypothetical protein n=1 Tax=Reyranella sp. TaxID=1929291 RepID=UPI003783362A